MIHSDLSRSKKSSAYYSSKTLFVAHSSSEMSEVMIKAK